MFNNEWKLDLTSKTFDVLDLELFKNYRFKTLFNYVVVFWGLTILKAVSYTHLDVYKRQGQENCSQRKVVYAFIGFFIDNGGKRNRYSILG